ncbi:hypothetical protein [Agarivorans sp. B2Z047]|uniref:hypothetical protein n=1 Tax=Agarivorans sp. B2Z047 TaxID=2652721 RepID=UPI0018834665|nr:hypothetical protein [Agarivorans sp. B2Z047]UQN43688.1 hypothetical protein LQZ07_04215 [Agarivorans sp. B2Z047]
MSEKSTNYHPFKLNKPKKFTLGRRQTEKADLACNKVGMTPEQVIKDEIAKKASLL